MLADLDQLFCLLVAAFTVFLIVRQKHYYGNDKAILYIMLEFVIIVAGAALVLTFFALDIISNSTYSFEVAFFTIILAALIRLADKFRVKTLIHPYSLLYLVCYGGIARILIMAARSGFTGVAALFGISYVGFQLLTELHARLTKGRRNDVL